MRELWLLLILWLALAFCTSSAEAGPKVKCHNRQFHRKREDTFVYKASVTNGLSGTTKNVSTMNINAKVVVTTNDGCEFFLQVFGAAFEEKLGNLKAEKLESKGLTARLNLLGLRFSMENGMVTAVKPSVTSTNADVLNIQRGILSILQMRQSDAAEIDEDVSGKCKTTYEWNQFGNTMTKRKDMNSCTDHKIIQSNIHGVPMDMMNRGRKDPVLESSSVCSYRVLKGKRGGLERVACEENFLVLPYSSETGNGAYIITKASLVRESSKKVKQWKMPVDETYESSIKYDYADQLKNKHVPAFKDLAVGLLGFMGSNGYRQSNARSAERFFELVTLLRHLTPENINEVIAQLDITQEGVRTVLLDSLVQCGTPSCMGVLFETIQKNNLQQELPRLLTDAAFIKEPTPEVIRSFLGMMRAEKQPKLLLLISTLVYKMCQQRPDECQKTGTIHAKLVEDIKYEVLALLGNDCRTRDPVKQNNILIALKAIGNMGQPRDAISLIHDCVQNAEHAWISVAAIQAVRRMALSEEDRNKFYELLTNKNEHLEKRVEAFLLVMKDPSEEHMILARDLANDKKDTGQMRSFVHSYLSNLINNPDPTQMRHAETLRKVLAKYSLDRFESSPWRYSKAFSHTLGMHRFGSSVSGMSLFHPESFLPRSLNLNLTFHQYGYCFNPFEMNLRMEGMEAMMPQMLGKDGGFGAGAMGKLFEIPENLDATRKRRQAGESSGYDDIDAKVNMKKSGPHAMLSMKIFGNEISLFTMAELMPMMGEMSNRNMIKELYELTKGKSKTYKQNMIMLEVSYSVPTIIGLPLKIAVNQSAVITVDLAGKVTTKNLLFGPKAATMDGSLKPSISMHGSGKLSVDCPGVGEVGTTFKSTMHAAKEWVGRVDYEEGKELKFDLKAVTEQKDVMNVSYNIFHQTTRQKVEIKGVEKRANARFCTNEFFPSHAFLGTDTCMDMSIPVSYYDMNVPYFPLNGPYKFGIREFPVDPKLTSYQMLLRKEGNLYTFAFSTPNATIERDFQVQMGSKEEGTGMFGVFVEKERRGFELKYNYDKETNGVEASFYSNITEKPVSVIARFYNDTNEQTLSRHIGGSLKSVVGQFYSEHNIYFRDNYDHWSIGGRFEYSPMQVAEVDLQVQYDPPKYTLTVAHPPTDTQLIAFALLNMPVIEANINFKHNKEISFSTMGKANLEEYSLETNTALKSYDEQPWEVYGRGQIFPEENKILVEGGDNFGTPWSWEGSYVRDGADNIVTNRIGLTNNKTMTNELRWSSKKMEASLSSGSFLAKWEELLNFYEDGFEFKGTVDYNGQVGKGDLKVNSAPDKTDICVTGNYKSPFGQCYTMFNTPNKKGIVIKVMNMDGKWRSLSKALYETAANGAVSSVIRLALDKSNIFHAGYQRDENQLMLKFTSAFFNLHWKKLKDDNEQFSVKTDDGIAEYELNVVSDMMDGGIYFRDMTLEMNGKELAHIGYETKIADGTFKYALDVNETDTKRLFSVVFRSKKFEDIEDYEGNTLIIEHCSKRKGISDIVFYPDNKPIRLSDLVSLTSLDLTKPGWMMLDLKIKNNPIFDYLVTQNGTSLGKFILSIVGKEIEYYVNNLFVDVLALDPKSATAFTNLYTQGLKEYFSSLECNGDAVREKYITGIIDDKMIADLIAKIITLPFSGRMSQLIKNATIDVDMSVIETLFSDMFDDMEKSVISILTAPLGKLLWMNLPASYNLLPFEGLPDLSKVLDDQTALEGKVMSYLQSVIDTIHKMVSSELEIVDVDSLFADIDKYVPADVGKKITKIIGDIIAVLKSWKYDINMTLFQNIESILNELEKANVHELLKLNYEEVLTKLLIDNVELPKVLKKPLMRFVRKSDYEFLLKGVTRVILEAYQVKDHKETEVDGLLNSDSLGDYIEAISTMIVERSQLAPKHIQPFKEYLKTRELETLFDQLQIYLEVRLLKSEYRSAYDLVNYLIRKIEIKSFSLKDLPEMLTPENFPKTLKNLINYFKKIEPYDLFVKVAEAFLPRIVETLDDILEDGIEKADSVSEAIWEIYKAIAEEVEKEYGDDTEEALMIKGITKYMKMFLKDEDGAFRLKNLIIHFYVKADVTSYVPERWQKSFETLTANILKHLKDMDVDMLRQNATVELVRVLNKCYEELVLSYDSEFKDLLKEELIELGKMLLAEFVEEETLEKFYAKALEYMDMGYQHLLKFLDQVIAHENMRFSFVATVENLRKYIQAFNYKGVNKLMDVYFKNKPLTYDGLLESIRLILDDIGKMEFEGKAINKHVQEFIPILREKMATAFMAANNRTESAYYLNIAKEYVNQFSELLQGFLQQARNKHTFFTFLIDLAVPGIDALFIQPREKPVDDFSPYGRASRSEHREEICRSVFRRTKYIGNPMVAESGSDGTSKWASLMPTEDFEEGLKEFRKSAECRILRFYRTLKDMKKDRYFFENFIEEIKQIAILRLDEEIAKQTHILEVMKSVFTGDAVLTDDDMQSSLGQLVFDVGARIIGLFKSTEIPDLKYVFTRPFGEKTFKSIVEENLLKDLQPKQLTPEQIAMIDQKVTKFMPVWMMVKTNFKNVSMLLMAGKGYLDSQVGSVTTQFLVDKFKSIMAESVYNEMIDTIEMCKREALSFMYAAERELRKMSAIAEAGFAKYRDIAVERFESYVDMINAKAMEYFDKALGLVDAFEKELVEGISGFNVEEFSKMKLRGKLKLLSAKTEEMKAKYDAMKQQFTAGLKKTILDALTKEKFAHASAGALLQPVLSNPTFKFLNMNLNQLVVLAVPELKKLDAMVDEAICDAKKELKAFLDYNYVDGRLYIKFPKPPGFDSFKTELLAAERMVMGALKKGGSYLDTVPRSFDDFKSLTNKYIEVPLERALTEDAVNRHEELRFFYQDIYKAYGHYLDMRPDEMIAKALGKYAGYFKRLGLQMKSAMEATPRLNIDAPIIKFLGLESKESKKMFRPLSRTAYLFDKSLVTFDGKPVFLPLDLNGKFTNCKYLLCRDFLANNFTIYLHRGKFVVELQDATVIIDKMNDNKVYVEHDGGVTSDFPAQFIYGTTVTRLPDAVNIESALGLQVSCQFDVFVCSVTVPGYYHNKTLGLFGTNNAEYADDFRMPNGNMALNVMEFANAYELTADQRCPISDFNDVFDTTLPSHKKSWCETAKERMMYNYDPFTDRRPLMLQTAAEAFTSVCSNEEDSCKVMEAFAQRTLKEYDVVMDMPCDSCMNLVSFKRFGKEKLANVDISFIIKLVPQMEAVKETLKTIMQRIREELGSVADMKYRVIGFGGEGIRKNPHIQTGSGPMNMLDNMVFTGKNYEERLGIDALKFAAGLKSHRRGPQIFFLFDNDPSYTNVLRQMIGVYDLLGKRGIVLNAVNNYKFKKGIIAKDSEKTRYLVRLPKGETFPRDVAFPPTDDYIPFVKETRGGVFSLKAFVKDKPELKKALPIAFIEVLRKQIETDVARCKECSCHGCKNLGDDYCDYNKRPE